MEKKYVDAFCFEFALRFRQICVRNYFQIETGSRKENFIETGSRKEILLFQASWNFPFFIPSLRIDHMSMCPKDVKTTVYLFHECFGPGIR